MHGEMKTWLLIITICQDYKTFYLVNTVFMKIHTIEYINFLFWWNKIKIAVKRCYII